MIRAYVVIILLFAFQARSAPPVFSKSDLAGGKLGDPFSFEAMLHLIERQKITTIEALLPQLPESMLSNYVLVYSSRSLQEASPQNPRAVLFGSDASFIMSFNGDFKQKGFDRIEMVQFREETKTFEFREIQFTENRTVVSAKNPVQCLGCHGQNPRPNWDGYFLWPGVFGSEDDHVYRTNPKFAFKKTGTEEVWFQNFLKNKKNHPRYKHLADVFSSKNTIQIGTEVRPASLLSHMLGRLNARKIAHELAISIAVDPWRYAVLGILACDTREWMTTVENILKKNNIRKWIPGRFSKSLKQNYKFFLEDTLRQQKRSQVARLKRHQDLVGPGFTTQRLREEQNLYDKKDHNEFFSVLAAFRYLNQIWKIDMQDWSMEFDPRSFIVNTPGNEFADIAFYYASEKFTEAPERALIPMIDVQEQNSPLCKTLEEKNIQSLEGLLVAE